VGEWRYSIVSLHALQACDLAHHRYLVQQYDKEYQLWCRDLKVQMEMTAWVISIYVVSNHLRRSCFKLVDIQLCKVFNGRSTI
jgi:hypothetical protein